MLRSLKLAQKYVISNYPFFQYCALKQVLKINICLQKCLNANLMQSRGVLHCDGGGDGGDALQV
jgi:hypothetical protein